MDTELIYALQSCIDSCESLKLMVAQDQFELRGALGGELLTECLKGTESARKSIDKIERKIIELQAEQKL